MVAALLAGLWSVGVLGSPPAQDVRRDFHFPVQNVQQFSAWAAGETGDVAIVSPEVADRDIYINVKQRTFAELLSYVAKAAGMKVIHQNGSLTFLPAPADPAKRFAYFTEFCDATGEPNLDESKIRAAVKKASELEEQLRQFEIAEVEEDRFGSVKKMVDERRALNRFDPAQAMLFDTLRTIGISGLSAIGDGERVVFSTHPSRLQRRWPSDAGSQIARFNRLAGAQAKSVAEFYGPEAADEELNVGDGVTAVVPVAETPAQAATLVIENDGGDLNVFLCIYGADGWALSASSSTLVTDISMEKYDDENRFEDVYSSLTQVLELSESEKRELGILSTLTGGSYIKLGTSDLELVSQFERQNMLAGVISKILDFGCEVTGNEVVTEVLDTGYWDGIDPVDGEYAAFYACGSPDKEVFNQLVVPEPPINAQQIRDQKVPGAAIARVAHALLSNESLNLDSVADAALLVPRRKQIISFFDATLLLSRQMENYNYSYSNWNVLALEIYAHLSPTDRRTARSAQGLMLTSGRMPKALQIAIDQSLANDTISLKDDIESDGEITAWLREQTNLLASAEAAPISFRLKVEDQVGIGLKSKLGGDENFQYITPEMLASYLDGMYFDGGVEYTFSAAPNVRLQIEIQAGRFPLDASPMTLRTGPFTTPGPYELLPAEVRRQVEYYKNLNNPPPE